MSALQAAPLRSSKRDGTRPWLTFIVAAIITVAIYWPGLSGAWLFDDYPNIVDNHDLQITDTHISSLVRAALSSPSSEFKRPLASLSFATNYLVAGLDPFSWKLTNVVIHLLNGLLVFLLARALLTHVGAHPVRAPSASSTNGASARFTPARDDRAATVAALIAAAWMLLPINLTAVLYVVQRMESLANLFVLFGLLGYVAGRQRMLNGKRGLWLCIASVILPTAIGLLAKETAVMLPLYAFLIEWIVFRFARSNDPKGQAKLHHGLLGLFVTVLALPLLAGLVWLLPGLLRPSAWATRDFTLSTRLLSEARIVADYIAWTLTPTPQALSFYHDNFRISAGLLSPWTTLASMALLAVMAVIIWTQRTRRPLIALGLALYLGCHLLTGTILPLELIYEHRNYFASFGLLLALVPPLAALAQNATPATDSDLSPASPNDRPLPWSLPRYVLLAGLMLLWATETALTANVWGNPLLLAQDLATRAPDSPRAQYELGRTYIIYSHYDPDSPFTRLAYAPLERAAAMPESSILPQQALIFMNSRMHIPLKDAWWDSMVAKLKAHKPGVQDESSLGALTQCAREHRCDLPIDRMMDAFVAALSHPRPSARLLATYGDYAWNVLEDRPLALRMANAAVAAGPNEPAYLITLARMLIANGDSAKARGIIDQLERLNISGRLDDSISALRTVLAHHPVTTSAQNGRATHFISHN
jgi:hypothetical protein